MLLDKTLALGFVFSILLAADDGNCEGLENQYLYTDEQARSVHLASKAILEPLQKVYKADRLLRELDLAT